MTTGVWDFFQGFLLSTLLISQLKDDIANFIRVSSKFFQENLFVLIC